MNQNRPYVLSIAGYDPSGGAGVLADVKVFEQHKVNGMAVATSITYQNEKDFEGVSWLTFDTIERQFKLLSGLYRFDFVKIGLIENLEILDKIVSMVLAANNRTKIIWDPILKASAGFSFHTTINQKLLSSILDKLFLITPNNNELFDLLKATGEQQLTLDSLVDKVNILVTGGHQEDGQANDVLYCREGQFVFQGEKLFNQDKHGSGCVLSAAVLSNLALGNSIEQSCALAKSYTKKFLQSNESLIGFHVL